MPQMLLRAKEGEAMSMLSAQCDGLREAANRLDEIGISMGHGTTASAFIAHDASERMRSAADTIERLRDNLQESYRQVPEQGKRENGGERESYSRWHQLFGTPERAAQTLETVAENLFSSAWSDDNATLSDVMCSLTAHCKECPAKGLPGRGVSTKCGEVDYDALLGWLNQEVDA